MKNIIHPHCNTMIKDNEMTKKEITRVKRNIKSVSL